MDETVITTSPNGRDTAIITLPSTSSLPSLPSNLQQVVCSAASFGWAMTELLGRCYLSPYATGTLANSAQLWWKAITSGQVALDPNGAAPVELQKQADIWYSLYRKPPLMWKRRRVR